jgi:hypothetical protein
MVFATKSYLDELVHIMLASDYADSSTYNRFLAFANGGGVMYYDPDTNGGNYGGPKLLEIFLADANSYPECTTCSSVTTLQTDGTCLSTTSSSSSSSTTTGTTTLTASVSKVILGPYSFTISSPSEILTTYTIQIDFPSTFTVADCTVNMGRVISSTSTGSYTYKTSTHGNKAATCTDSGDSVTIASFLTASAPASS